MKKYTIGIIAISFILVLIFGTFFQAAPSVTEVLNALEKVDEFEYHACIKDFEKLSNSTTILHGGVSLNKMEAYAEQVNIYENGKSVFRDAIYDDVYYVYAFIINNNNEIIGKIPLKNYTQDKREFLKKAAPFNGIKLFIKELLVNGTIISVEKHEGMHVFIIKYQREIESKNNPYLYKLSLNASIFVKNDLPMRILVNGTYTSIHLLTNETRTAFTTYEANITYSYTTPEWLQELKGAEK